MAYSLEDFAVRTASSACNISYRISAFGFCSFSPQLFLLNCLLSRPIKFKGIEVGPVFCFYCFETGFGHVALPASNLLSS